MHRAGTARRVTIVAYPGFQSLDVAGPLEVFAPASELSEHSRKYQLLECCRARCIEQPADVTLRRNPGSPDVS